MKKLFLVTTLASLGACSWLGSVIGDKPEAPKKEREEFFACPDYEKCAGKYKSGGICEPSGEHHSTKDMCPYKK